MLLANGKVATFDGLQEGHGVYSFNVNQIGFSGSRVPLPEETECPRR